MRRQVGIGNDYHADENAKVVAWPWEFSIFGATDRTRRTVDLDNKDRI